MASVSDTGHVSEDTTRGGKLDSGRARSASRDPERGEDANAGVMNVSLLVSPVRMKHTDLPGMLMSLYPNCNIAIKASVPSKLKVSDM